MTAHITHHTLINTIMKSMITYDHDTLRLFGIPLFTLIVGVLFVAALAGLFFGIPRWKKAGAKITVIASSFILLIFAAAIVLVILTVRSGSMG